MTTFHTVDEAWNNQFRTISLPEECSICREPFDPDHKPVCFIGSTKCTHIFGAVCLREWLNYNASNHTINCPICRQTWFHFSSNDANSVHTDDEANTLDNDAGEEEEEEEEMDADDSDWQMEGSSMGSTTTTLEALRNRDTAAVFVSTLYQELLICESDAEDEAIKACVERALLDADLYASVPLPAIHWAQLQRMVKRMLRDSKITGWDD